MATSGSTDWTVTRDDIVRGALRAIGALAAGEAPSAEDTADASEALNMMCKAWQAEDIGLWLIGTGDIPLVADQQVYTIGTGGDLDINRPLDIIEARFYNATDETETPMILMSRQEYYALPTKDSTGIPTQYYWEPHTDYIYTYIWPVWDDTTSDLVKVSYKGEVEDFDTNADNPDFPKEWFRALKFNLAVEIAPEFGVEPTQNLLRLARESKFNATSWDRERGSVYFAAEQR